MASLAERSGEPVDSDEHARSTCGVLDLRQQLVRRSVWQWDGRRQPTSMVCWWRSDGEDSAPAGDDGRNAPRRDQHDTRRHPATSVSFWDGDRRLRSVSLAP